MLAALRPRLRHLLIECGGLVGIATFVFYAWLAPTHIVDGDNAEFSTLAHVGGIAHPPGYPLYVLWLRATSWLPAASPAHAAALATAILGSLSIVVLHAACRAWGARPIAATLTVAVFAAGSEVLRLNTEAEVFALNNLVAATVLWLAARRGPATGAWRVGWLALVAGLGMANQLTCVLIAPIGVLGIVRGLRETQRSRLLGGAIGIGAFAIGLSPYLYLFLAADTAASWGHIDSLQGLLDHFLRRDYGGPGAFSVRATAVPLVDNLAAWVATLGCGWVWLPAAAGLAALGVRIARPGDRETRWAWGLLALSFVLAGPLLVARFDTRLSVLGLYAVRRFHVLSAVILAVPIAIAFDEVGRRLQARWATRLLQSAIAGTMIAIVVFLTIAGASLPRIGRIYSPAVELGVRNTLRSLPIGAVWIESQGMLHYGAAYVQLARGERRDIAVVTWTLVPLAWYRTHCARQGIVIDIDSTGDPAVVLAEKVMASGRALFVDAKQVAILKALPSYPFGLGWRVLPRGSKPPTLDEILELNKTAFEHFDLAYRFPGTEDEFAAAIHALYATTWRTIGQGFAAAGRHDAAEAALDFAKQIGPQP